MIRFVDLTTDVPKLCETFLSFQELKAFNAEYIVGIIWDVLDSELDLKPRVMALAQCYDGARFV